MDISADSLFSELFGCVSRKSFMAVFQHIADPLHSVWNDGFHTHCIARYIAFVTPDGWDVMVHCFTDVFQTIGMMPLFFRYSHAAASVSTPSSFWSLTIFI